jgi:hypothetical protein
MEFSIPILTHTFWVKLMFFYQYLFYSSLAFQQAQKKLIMFKNYDEFSKMVENRLFYIFISFCLMFCPKFISSKSTWTVYGMINISKFYFGKQNIRQSKFWPFFGLYIKICSLPNGILFSIPFWKTFDLQNKIIARNTQIF